MQIFIPDVNQWSQSWMNIKVLRPPISLFIFFHFFTSLRDTADSLGLLKPNSISNSRGAAQIICVQWCLKHFYTRDDHQAFTEVLIWLTT